jgi:hypothetical protein
MEDDHTSRATREDHVADTVVVDIRDGETPRDVPHLDDPRAHAEGRPLVHVDAALPGRGNHHVGEAVAVDVTDGQHPAEGVAVIRIARLQPGLEVQGSVGNARPRAGGRATVTTDEVPVVALFGALTQTVAADGRGGPRRLGEHEGRGRQEAAHCAETPHRPPPRNQRDAEQRQRRVPGQHGASWRAAAGRMCDRARPKGRANVLAPGFGREVLGDHAEDLLLTVVYGGT